MSNLFHKCNGCRYKGEHQEMGFASMGVCTRTTNLVEAEKNYKAEKSPYKKTEFELIKAKIAKMNLTDFIEFCGGESCENIICGEIPKEKAHCSDRKEHDCGKCIKQFLESEVSE